MRYLVTYDIIDNKRRTKLAKSLKDFGDRVQYSVFECLLDSVLYEAMVSRIKKIINEDEDGVRIYPICRRCEDGCRIIGLGKMIETREAIVF